MRVSFSLKRVVIYVGAVLLLLWTVIPVYWLLNLAFMFNVEMIAVPTHFYPHNFTLSNFLRLFNQATPGPTGQIMLPVPHGPLVQRGLVNSLIIAAITTPLTLAIALPIAYVLGRFAFPHKGKVMMAILLSRAYPPMAAIIPFFGMYLTLGLRGTHFGLTIVYLSGTIPLIVWIMMGFFNALPKSLEAAARVDGCTRFQAFYRVMIPMALPGIAACAVITFLSVWNEFLFSFLLNSGSNALTFPPTLSNMFFQYFYPTEAAAATVLGMAPVAVIAFVFQRWIRNLNIVDPL
jgi:multiple sugar transport system permease protein